MKTTFNIVLYRPQIPPNTGNIARLCVGTQCCLHLIGKLGFSIENKQLKRAGLDYWENLNMKYYNSLEDFLDEHKNNNIWLVTKFGEKKYSEVKFNIDDYFIFGRETTGLPEPLHKNYYNKRLYIPMNNKVRSINLSNSVAILLYEAIRQNNIDFINDFS